MTVAFWPNKEKDTARFTRGHDSGAPKYIRQPRQRWTLGADIEVTNEDRAIWKIVVAAEMWALRVMFRHQTSQRKMFRWMKQLNKEQIELTGEPVYPAVKKTLVCGMDTRWEFDGIYANRKQPLHARLFRWF